jgi:short-subunit dehydrogenase
MRSLAGKRVLITGGGGGLGRALALRFAAAGCHVIVADRDAASAERVAGEVKGAAYRLDVTDPADVLSVRDRVLAAGPLDVLVNNAGVVFGGGFSDVALDRHHRTIGVNLGGVITLTHAFLADLVARPEAHVVNVVSASAFIPLAFGTTYAASKWAALGFSESLRDELRVQGRRHVGITAVCPSYVRTGLFDGAVPPRLTDWLTPDRVAAATVRAVLRNQGVVILPRRVRLLLALGGVLPWPVWRRMMALLGVSTSMQGWRGR